MSADALNVRNEKRKRK